MRNFDYVSYFLNYTTIASDNVVMLGIGNVKPTKLTTVDTNIFQIVSMSKLVAIDRASKPCKAEISSPSSYDNEINIDGSGNSCHNLCMYKKQNVTNTSCVKNHQFIGLQYSEELELRICSNYNVSSFVLEPDAECKLRCLESCTQWFYSATSQVSRSGEVWPLRLNIEINFQLSHSVMVSEEVAAYTWTTLIGNIGGLLGIWLGASLLSFLQSLYLLSSSNNKVEAEQFSGNEIIELMERVRKIEQFYCEQNIAGNFDGKEEGQEARQ